MSNERGWGSESASIQNFFSDLALLAYNPCRINKIKMMYRYSVQYTFLSVPLEFRFFLLGIFCLVAKIILKLTLIPSKHSFSRNQFIFKDFNIVFLNMLTKLR